MVKYPSLMDFFTQTLFLEKWNTRLRGLGSGFAFSSLFSSLLFLASRLFNLQIPFFFYLIPFIFLMVPLFKKSPDPLLLISKIDKNLKMEERLVTSFEVLRKGGPRSFLENLLLEDVQERIKGMKPREGLSREGSKKALIMVLTMISLIIFSVSPFLSRIQFQGGSLQGWLSQANEILDEISILEWPFKEQAFVEVLKAKTQIEEGNYKEAVLSLEEARELLKDALENDALTQKELAISEELSFLTWTLENESPAELFKLKDLGKDEQITRAKAIEEKIKDLPPGPLRSSLEELVSTLKKEGRNLSEVANKILSVKEKTELAYNSLGNLISQLGESPEGKGVGDIAKILPEEVQPGQGMGTKGGISTKKEEDKKDYVKSPYAEENTFQEGLIYLPPSFSGEKGEPLILPKGEEGKFQVFLPGESSQETFYYFREALSSYEKVPWATFFRQALPPFLDQIVDDYYQRLEAPP